MTSNQPAVAIIGFGVAGFNAAAALRTHGYDGPIMVFSDTDMLPYSPILTSYYAGGEKTYGECFPWSQEEVDELDLQVMSECPATGLDVDAQLVHTLQGSFTYSKCIIATGATPMTLGFPQECGYEPLVLRTMADAVALKDAITNPGCQRMLVSGASMVALKTLEACLNRGVQVTLVGMNPHVLDFNALPPAAERYERGLRAKGVDLRLGQTIKEVEVVPSETHPLGRELKVTFSTGDVQTFDHIAVAHGMKCNLDFVPQGALDTDRALLVDQFMRTSNPNVYAAGDIVQATELVSGQKRIVGIWKNAALQGACAGTAVAAELAGREVPESCAFAGSIPMNSIAVNGTLFLSAGAMELGENRTMEVRETGDMTVVYVFETSPVTQDRRLVGFNITCDSDEAGGVAYDTGAMLTRRICATCS